MARFYLHLGVLFYTHNFIIEKKTHISTSGGRHVQTFSKVCMSLQSLRLEDFLQTFFCGSSTLMQTFCRLFLRIIYSNADFLQTFFSDHLL
jgi:hypothetical protein